MKRTFLTICLISLTAPLFAGGIDEDKDLTLEETPFSNAVIHYFLDMELMFDTSIPVNFIKAAREGDLEKLCGILNEGFNTDYRNENGEGALSVATDGKIIHYLLNHVNPHTRGYDAKVRKSDKAHLMSLGYSQAAIDAFLMERSAKNAILTDDKCAIDKAKDEEDSLIEAIFFQG